MFVKACVRYFSLFLKEQFVSGLFRTKYFEKKFNLKHVYMRPEVNSNRLKISLTFPLFHEHLFPPGLPRATRLLQTSCLEKITVCVIETMLVTLPLAQMNKARREVSQQIKYKSR